MNILRHRLEIVLQQSLTRKSTYQAFIYLKDHDKKINPQESKLNLSYMDPKNQSDVKVKDKPFSAKLRRSAHDHLQKKLFENYKIKILEGKIDEQAVVEPDPLWGGVQKPEHYYRSLSGKQIGSLSHSIWKDIQQHQQALVTDYLREGKKVSSIEEVADIDDLAELASFYRMSGVLQTSKFYEIEQRIGNKFHLLSNRSLILLKYAFLSTPKQCTPQFNKIINNLLLESLPQLSTSQLVHLMYYNRKDRFHFHKNNLQISIIEQITHHFHSMSLQQKIDFLFLFVDSRGPTIRPQSHHRHFNEIRNRTQEIIYYLDFKQDLSTLAPIHVLKLAYSLVRANTSTTRHITLSICRYLQAKIEELSPEQSALFFIYLGQIEGNRSVSNMELMKSLKGKVLKSWEELASINKIRALDTMYTLKLYDEVCHDLYTKLPMESDSTALACFSRIEMMNSSGRQWEVIHLLAKMDYVPLAYFQDYKRFYNYISITAPDWNLEPIAKKLENTQIFYDSTRFISMSMDKRFFREIAEFQKFSSLRCLPKPFKMGQPIKNIEYCEFMLPQYQISIDIINDVQRIPGTKQVKGTFLTKIKSLENIGWKHLYVFEQDVDELAPLEFFEHLYKICEPHFEPQLKIIAAHEEYRSYEIDQLRIERAKNFLKMKQRQRYMDTGDFNAVGEERDIQNLENQRKQLEQMNKQKEE